MPYHLEGRLLEVCNCRVLCPCWIGEDPDFGTCDTIVAWHFDKGTVDGVDVSGITLAAVAHVPGNILQGNWRAAVYVSDHATKAQEEAILGVYTGQKGGPVAELAKLVGEVVSVEKVPIKFDVHGGSGTLQARPDSARLALATAWTALGITALSGLYFAVLRGPAVLKRGRDRFPGLGLCVRLPPDRCRPGTKHASLGIIEHHGERLVEERGLDQR